MIAVTVPLSNGRSRIDYIYFMEQVLLAPKTGQSKAILSRRFALFISFNWTLQLQWDQEYVKNENMFVLSSSKKELGR